MRSPGHAFYVTACLLLMAITLLSLAASHAAEVQLLEDRQFLRGFSVLAPDGGAVQGIIQADPGAGEPGAGEPAWELAQWASQSTIYGVAPTILPLGATEYTNPDKTIIFGGGTAAAEADLILGVNSISEYDGGYREEGRIWPHLVAQQGVSGPGSHLHGQAPAIADMTSLDFHIDVKLLKDNRLTDPEQGYNPNMHASQFGTIFTIQNLNQASAGYGDRT